MSKQSNDGGPAFAQPAVFDPTREQVNPAAAYGADAGMTLRDYFAAKAMAAIIQTWPQIEDSAQVQDEDSLLRVTAGDAYRFADAMLAAREAP